MQRLNGTQACSLLPHMFCCKKQAESSQQQQQQIKEVS
jgi:hypothetical protein